MKSVVKYFVRGSVLMIKIQEIREIIKLVDASTIDEFVYETEGTKIKLKKIQIQLLLNKTK